MCQLTTFVTSRARVCTWPQVSRAAHNLSSAVKMTSWVSRLLDKQIIS